jgi:hypothetical protein
MQNLLRATALGLVSLTMSAPAQTVRIDAANPHYFSYQGKPTLLNYLRRALRQSHQS